MSNYQVKDNHIAAEYDVNGNVITQDEVNERVKSDIKWLKENGTALSPEQVTNLAKVPVLESQLDENVNKTKPSIIQKTFLTSDSLGGAGNLQTQLRDKFGLTDGVCLNNVKGGQHISTGLLAVCDKIKVNQLKENRLLWSNNLTKTEWRKVGYTVTKERLPFDGQVWNKLSKTDDTANKFVAQTGGMSGVPAIQYPTDAKGITVSLDLYVDDDNFKNIGVYVENQTTYKSLYYISAFPQETIKGYHRIVLYYPESEVDWVKGANDTIQVTILANKNAGDKACTFYVKDVSLSFKSPNGYNNYVATAGTSICETTPSLDNLRQNKYVLNDIDLGIIQYGRNDSGDGEGYIHFFNALDKLMYNMNKFCKYIIPLNPPPLKASGESWQPTDSYTDYNYLNTFKKYMFRYNSGVNVYDMFKKVAIDGTYLPSQLMADPVHYNDLGASLVVNEIYKEVNKNIKYMNSFNPLVKDEIVYYPLGNPTGTWKLKSSDIFDVEQKFIIGEGKSSIGITSSVANDYLEFNNIECTQIHVIYRQKTNCGRFEVIIDEGSGSETRNIYDEGIFTGDRQAGRFVCAFDSKGVHNIKIKLLDNKETIIHGIVTI